MSAPEAAPAPAASAPVSPPVLRDPRYADPRESLTSALPSYIEEIERNAIQQALEDNRYNKTKAAAALGITFRALRYKLKKLGID
jgi:two-component system response regulator PilR (NtrC family)